MTRRLHSPSTLPVSAGSFRFCQVFAAIALLAAIGSDARAQLSTLDKGHQIIVNNGLQIWGLDTFQAAYPVNYSELSAANMTAVMWSYDQSAPGTLIAGQKWGKWVQANPAGSGYTAPANTLNATEAAHQNDLIALQIGDEQQSDMEDPNGYTKAWFDAAHANNLFTNQLLYVNSFFIGNGTNYANFIHNANPDAISWDSYPFANPHGHYILPKNWLSLGNTFRRYGLGSYIGATNSPARPYGMYLQTYYDTFAVEPGEAEIRWQQFAAWTMGYKFVDAFIYRGGNNNFGGQPTGPVYLAFQETARQGENLGPALSKLISYGYGPSFIQGAASSGMPGEWIAFDRNNAQASQRYLTGVSNVTNLGTKNGGLSGDVYVGFFNPLHLSFGDPTGTTYFMVMNGLGGDLALPNGQSDNTATVAQTRQQMTLNFDFGVTGINSLLRLNRNTGAVDVVNTSYTDGGNTVFTSLGDGKYQLQLKLDGGTGDLFKYNDGTPFVGVQAALPHGYWDNDASAGNNNVETGAGIGGSGNWDAASAKWYNGTTNSAYATNSNVVFAGTAGTVTLTAPKSVTSLQFKTDGYTLAGSTLTLASPTITVDSGATATIRSTLAGSSGLIKNGPGKLVLAGANTYGGATTIHEGVLAVDTTNGDISMAGIISGASIEKIGTGTVTLSAANRHAQTIMSGGAVLVASDANLGAAPASLAAGSITFNGGTLRFGANVDINNNRGITINAAGGTIDTQGFSNPAGYSATAGGFSGPGDLTKLGSGTFFAAATTGGANTTWKGKLILKEGTWKIVASDGLPYNVPVADGLQAGQVTFDGGTLQIGATINVTNGRRGMTVTSNGGTFDTQGFNFTWAGPLNGSVSTANFNKIGSGQLQFNTFTSAPGTFNGNMNINGGTLVLNGSGAMGDLASISLANAAGVGLTIQSGPEVIGSLAGGGAAGGNVSLASTLFTGGNYATTTFSGLLSGAGGLTKNGSGTFTLDRPAGNTYSGVTTISAGTLLVNNTSGSGTGTNSVIVNNGAVLGGTGKVSGAVTVNNGGHIAPGASIESLDVGTLTLAAGSVLDFELDTILGTDMSDLLNVTTNNGITINGGTLNLINAANMTGGIFTLIDYGGVLNGSLSNIVMGSTPGGFSYRLLNDASGTLIQLEVTAPGDYNHDGFVDAGDYVTLRKGLGTKYAQADIDAWRANFGQSYPNGAGTSIGAVPEPAAWILLSLGAAWMFACQRSCFRAR